jgi:hypothetical protein
MKEITLEDLKTEINNNLWRVTKIGKQGLQYNSPLYVRFDGDELDVFVILGQNVLHLFSYRDIEESNFLNYIRCYYEEGKIQELDFEERLNLNKEEMNKELFNLVKTAKDLPF